ncbi:MAG: hypothetical protein IJD20_05170 [Oscillospiraceae bacterium]|nr:hypothetical protein [Oscillospiraceae bacterium]MBR2366515.1 hypothetical protein [Oscillospiraceae bacterium]MBR2977628.1 hypothetical protein [Oscillospiraceae bacterium]
MTEWGVVGVLIAIVGLIISIARPLLSLNTAITRLTTELDGLRKDIQNFTTKNESSHDRIWKKAAEQDATLGDHEHRLTVLEAKNT